MEVKTDREGFVKDLNSGGILNTDFRAAKAYRDRRAAKQSQEERLNKIEGDLADIKNMLLQFLQKK